jgi:hypothetical protein
LKLYVYVPIPLDNFHHGLEQHRYIEKLLENPQGMKYLARSKLMKASPHHILRVRGGGGNGRIENENSESTKTRGKDVMIKYIC